MVRGTHESDRDAPSKGARGSWDFFLAAPAFLAANSIGESKTDQVGSSTLLGSRPALAALTQTCPPHASPHASEKLCKARENGNNTSRGCLEASGVDGDAAEGRARMCRRRGYHSSSRACIIHALQPAGSRVH